MRAGGWGKYYRTLSSRQRMATARTHSQQLWFTCTRLCQSTFHYEWKRGLWGSTPSHELLATNYCFGKGKSSFFGGTANGRLFIQVDDPVSTSMQVALMKFNGKTICCQVWSLEPTRRERFLQTVFWPTHMCYSTNLCVCACMCVCARACSRAHTLTHTHTNKSDALFWLLQALTYPQMHIYT